MSVDGNSGTKDAVADELAGEDLAGIAALAELVAKQPETSAPFSVPLSALAGGTRRKPANAAGSGGASLKPRVLLVEDNPVNRLLVGVLLDRLGLDHVAVGCGKEAVYRFAREPFDAILIDATMDGMGGIATAQAIRRLVGDDMPPLVALRSADFDDDILEEAGFSSVADAPLDTNRLAAALITAIEKDLEAALDS